MASQPANAEKSLHGFVLRELEKSKGGWRTVASESEVSWSTIRKIASGVIVSPRVRNMEKLAGYFRAKRKRRS